MALHSTASIAGRGKNAGPEKSVLFGRFHAARILLLVVSEPDRAARGIGFPYCALLPVDPHHSGALYSQASGHSLQLDVSMFWGVHSGLRRHAHDGGLDHLVSFVLGRWGTESRDGGLFRGHRDLTDSVSSAGAGPAWHTVAPGDQSEAHWGSRATNASGVRVAPSQRGS